MDSGGYGTFRTNSDLREHFTSGRGGTLVHSTGVYT
jgi:hypothetical protein